MKVKDLFQQHLEWRAKIGNEPKTIKEVTRFLGQPIYQAVGERSLKSLRLTDTAEVINKGTKYGIYGVQRSVCYYRQLLKYATESGVRLQFDWHDIKIPGVPEKRVEYLSATEIEDIRNCFDVRELPGLRTRALVELLLDTGLRIGEAISLNKNDVNYDTLEIQVRNIKTDEWGTVYMTNRSAEWLKLYQSQRRDSCEALFVSGRNRLLAVTSRNYIRHRTRHLPFAKRICHHVFRRTLGTTLAHEKIDLKTVKDILRHKSERTTLRYYIGTDKERSKQLHRLVVEKIFGSVFKRLSPAR